MTFIPDCNPSRNVGDMLNGDFCYNRVLHVNFGSRALYGLHVCTSNICTFSGYMSSAMVLLADL